MIEKYIEKEIMRQVKLVEYLYEYKKLSIVDLATRLDVSYNTVKRDIQSLTIHLKEYIEQFEFAKTHVSIYFYSTYTRYDLILKLYDHSKVLNVCLNYLNGDDDYLLIVKNEYVSPSKAFQLKKRVENYLTAIGIWNEHGEWVEDEYTFRLVTLTVLSRKILTDRYLDIEKLNVAKETVEKIFLHLSNMHTRNKREHTFLSLGVYLTVTRFQEHPLPSVPEAVHLKESLAFRVIKQQLKRYFKEIHLNDDEFLFLTILYKNMPLDTDTYVNTELNYQYERKHVIENHPTIESLIFKFEEEFHNHLFYQIMFERPFIFFCYSMFHNAQNFILYRHYYLNEQQLHLRDSVKKVLYEWKREVCPEAPFIFNDLAIEWFVSQVSFSLTLKGKQKRVFFIVAENEESHIIYRESLKYWINLDYNMIDSHLYYSLDQLSLYSDKNPHVIICERSILPVSEINHPHLFPISRRSIREDIKVIILENCF